VLSSAKCHLGGIHPMFWWLRLLLWLLQGVTHKLHLLCRSCVAPPSHSALSTHTTRGPTCCGQQHHRFHARRLGSRQQAAQAPQGHHHLDAT
jgi:hypothetical protein